jgi:hypothetical protein
MPRPYPTLFVLTGLFLTWQALVAAGESHDTAADAAAIAEAKGMSSEFQFAIRFVGRENSDDRTWRAQVTPPRCS